MCIQWIMDVYVIYSVLFVMIYIYDLLVCITGKEKNMPMLPSVAVDSS